MCRVLAEENLQIKLHKPWSSTTYSTLYFISVLQFRPSTHAPPFITFTTLRDDDKTQGHLIIRVMPELSLIWRTRIDLLWLALGSLISIRISVTKSVQNHDISELFSNQPTNHHSFLAFHDQQSSIWLSIVAMQTIIYHRRRYIPASDVQARC